MNKIIYVLGSLSVVLIILIGSYNIPKGDDYCLNVELRNSSIVEASIHTYMTWDGRALLSRPIQSAMLRDLGNVPAFSSVLALIFVATIFSSGLFIDSAYRKGFVLRGLILTIVSWLTMQNIIGESVYWITGGVAYTMPYLFLLLFMYMENKKVQHLSGQKKVSWLTITVVYFFISTVMSLTGTQYSLQLFVFSMALFPFFRKSLSREAIYFLFFIIAGIIIGSIVVSAAPGNFIRAQYGPSSFNFDVDAFTKFIEKVLAWLKIYAKSMAPLIIAGSISYNLLTISKFKDDKFSYKKYSFTIVWLLCAFSSLVPFIVVPDFFFPRTTILFMFPGSIFLWNLVQLIIHFIADKYHFYEKRILLIRSVGLCMFLILSLFQVKANISDIKKAKVMKEFFDNRHEMLLRRSGSPVDFYVDGFTGEVPVSLDLFDVSSEPRFFINQCVADFYNIKSIRLINKNLRNKE